MPDLRTELQTKVVPALDNLKFDDEDEAPTTTAIVSQNGRGFQPTTNVSRTTFEFIRDNPRRYTRSEVGRLLVAQGHKLSSVYALITQMLRVGTLVKDEDRKLIANIQEYRPIKRVLAKKRGRPPKVTVKPTTIAHTPPAPTVSRKINIEDLKLSEARELYDALKKIFG